MPKAYWVSVYTAVNDTEKLAAYAKLAGPALTANGGRFLARGEPAKVYEKGQMQRTVLLEFDTVAAIVAMVSAGLGISLVQLADPKLCQMYPVRIVRLGRGAPALQLSLITRKADDDDRALGAVRNAMTSVCVDAQRHRTASGV